MKRLKNKSVGATQTAQPRSLAKLAEEGKDLTIKKPEKDDNVKLLLTLCDSANELYEKLSMLSNALEKRIEEQSLYKEVNK